MKKITADNPIRLRRKARLTIGVDRGSSDQLMVSTAEMLDALRQRRHDGGLFLSELIDEMIARHSADLDASEPAPASAASWESDQAAEILGSLEKARGFFPAWTEHERTALGLVFKAGLMQRSLDLSGLEDRLEKAIAQKASAGAGGRENGAKSGAKKDQLYKAALQEAIRKWESEYWKTHVVMSRELRTVSKFAELSGRRLNKILKAWREKNCRDGLAPANQG